MTNTPKRKLDPKVAKRQAIEKRIVRAFAKSAFAAGFTLLIDNGGDDDERIATSTVRQTMKEIMATDEDRIYVMRDGKAIGWAYFVYGNSGWDVLSDYTVNLEEKYKITQEAQALAEKLES